MSAKKATKTKSEGFTAEERAAMRERAREAKGKANGEAAVLEKIAEMPKPDRVLAERLHEIIKESAPDLAPKTWYGMPAYANEAGKVVCFFQSAEKFKSRYATLGFRRRSEPRHRGDVANLIRAEGVDRHRREEDQRAREEGGDLRT